MNDAERDAWLREALRHAPDSAALPPTGVSEAILAQARAAARKTQPLAPRRAPGATASNPLLAFWDWLARPPVAAGFASVMAATIVGLMWWDRPMDEALPRRPDAVSDRAPAAASESVAPAQTTATAPTPAKDEEQLRAAVTPSTAAAPEPRRVETTPARSELAQSPRQAPSGRSASARDDASAPAPADEERKRANVRAKEIASPADRTVAAPAPFPALDDQRAAAAPKAPVARAKQDAADGATASADSPKAAGATAGSTSVAAERAAAPAAPAVPAETAKMRAQPETARAPAPRRADDGERRAAASSKTEPDAAKGAPAAVEPAQTPALRRDALREREPQASAFASPPPAAPAPPRSELAAAPRDDLARAAPLASVLGEIATRPERWSRSNASGSVVALDAGWRAWLAELDAATAGRWRQEPAGAVGAAADGASLDGATLRLVASGRAPVVVRVEGSTVRIDGSAPGERWHAIVPAAVAERLRAAAARLSR